MIITLDYESPESWDDQGMDWSNPSAQISKYMDALRLAIIERLNISNYGSVPDIISPNYIPTPSRVLDSSILESYADGIDRLIALGFFKEINNNQIINYTKRSLYDEIEEDPISIQPYNMDNSEWIKQQYKILNLLTKRYYNSVSFNGFTKNASMLPIDYPAPPDVFTWTWESTLSNFNNYTYSDTDYFSKIGSEYGDWFGTSQAPSCFMIHTYGGVGIREIELNRYQYTDNINRKIYLSGSKIDTGSGFWSGESIYNNFGTGINENTLTLVDDTTGNIQSLPDYQFNPSIPVQPPIYEPPLGIYDVHTANGFVVDRGAIIIDYAVDGGFKFQSP